MAASTKSNEMGPGVPAPDRVRLVKHWLTSGVSAMAMLSVSTLATGPAVAASMDDLVAAAKKEGQLTVIALPHDWCGYGGVIDGFKAEYGLEVNELRPGAGSSAE